MQKHLQHLFVIDKLKLNMEPVMNEAIRSEI